MPVPHVFVIIQDGQFSLKARIIVIPLFAKCCLFFPAKIPVKTETNNWWNTAFSWKRTMLFCIKTSSNAFNLKSRQEPFDTECGGQPFQWELQFDHISSLFSLRYLNRWFIAPSMTQGINFSVVLNIIYEEILVCSECDKNRRFFSPAHRKDSVVSK